jgi:SAM-dependent methyltransferase
MKHSNVREKVLREEVVRRVERGRLAYYKKAANADYWDKFWKKRISPEYFVEFLKGNLGLKEQIFTKYLPINERILEAGCGTAKWVIALRQRGYNVEGIDWGRQTIERIHALFPDLPIRYGDASALPVEDGFYGAYISLGVIEHRAAGPEPFLAEAFRVLRPGGIAIFSVPWFNPVRRLKALLGCFKEFDTKGMSFYQYAFRTTEIKKLLAAAGFKVLLSRSTRNIREGFEDEFSFLGFIYEYRKLGKLVKRLIRSNRFPVKYCGHTRIYVCRKRS